MGKIKILHIISSLTRGGRERQLANIVSYTNTTKYQTKIIYFNIQQNSYIQEYGLSDFCIRVKSFRLLGRLLEIHKILKEENPHVVFSWGNGESIAILLLKTFHHYKFINGSIRHGIRDKKYSHYFRTIILRLSKKRVANSYAGLRANNLKRGYVLYNGIDNKFTIHFSQQQKLENKRKLLDINEYTMVLISVGNFVPYKDYFTILKALKKLKEVNNSFHYIILGDGHLRSIIEEKINEYDLKDYIKLVGHIENVWDYLRVADIFIHSSKGEGCSNAILEAMYAGLPVIASDVGGVPETVYPGSSMLFPYKDHEALYRCLLKSQELKESFDPDSEDYQAHLRKFSVETMVRRFEEIIDIVTKKRN